MAFGICVGENLAATYARPLGIQLLDALLAEGKRIFTTDDARQAAAALGIKPSTLPTALHQLSTSGWVRRVRNGLYMVDETRRGGPAPHPFAIATALVDPSAISHWTALAHHGLTEQTPRIVTASTPKDIVTPRMRAAEHEAARPASVWEVDGLPFRYFRVQQSKFWGFDEVWVDEFSRVRITDRERTVLDGFLTPDAFGSLSEILGVLDEHLGEIEIHRLVAYAIRYGQGATIKRLGYILEELGASADVVRPLREAPIRGYRLLDPHGPEFGPYVPAWHIRANLPRR